VQYCQCLWFVKETKCVNGDKFTAILTPGNALPNGEYHSREEARQVLDGGEQFDIRKIMPLYGTEDVVERDREATYHKDVG